jgi:hypothetical protein
VLVQVGEAFFLHSRTSREILQELRVRNIELSVSEISYLAKKFIIYLALLHKQVQQRATAFLNLNGGYLLHLDGTCEGESPHLISVLDGITEVVLDNVKMPSESSQDLIPFLQRIQSRFGEPIAVVSDMGKALIRAVQSVFPTRPHFLCHYHFLRDVGKDLLGADYQSIRTRLNQHGIQSILRKRARELQQRLGDQTAESVAALLSSLETEDLATAAAPSAELAAYTLMKWALVAKNHGQGAGFPFDQPHLVFYQRLLILHTFLHNCSGTRGARNRNERDLLTRIARDLAGIKKDAALRKAAASMEEKLPVFNQLRAAMRITFPYTNHGLNDRGDLTNLKTIAKAVERFRNRLSRKINSQGADRGYQQLIAQLDKYWGMLFADPLVVETEAGPLIIQPQRTNNLMEQFFRALMRSFRKRNGFEAMERILTTMLKDTPLVMNLRNKAFRQILLDEKETLADRFAEIDAEAVREELHRSSDASDAVAAKLKKLFTSPNFPDSLLTLVSRKPAQITDTSVKPLSQIPSNDVVQCSAGCRP